MKKLIVSAMLALSLLYTPKANSQTRVSGSVQAFDYQGLGYSLPVVEFGVGLDKSFSQHFELDTYGSYSIAHKAILGNGHDVLAIVTPIVWIDRTIGLTGQIRYSHLYTSAYDKGTFLPTSISQIVPSIKSFTVAPGVVFRASPLGLPSRLWVDMVIPSGTINRTTGIESNREFGLEFVWEASLYNIGPVTLRGEIEPSFYQGFNQGNPVCDGTDGPPVTCGRTEWNTYAIGLGIKIVWPKDTNKVW